MSDVNAVFELLDAWRHLPSYQLERRADIFFALYLRKVLKVVLGRSYDDDVIVPEFPLRLGTIRVPGAGEHDNHSFKADYLLADSKGATLVELKTELRSRNDDQDTYLVDASGHTLDVLVGGALLLAAKSRSPGKYRALLQHLRDAGLVEGDAPSARARVPVDVVYLQPARRPDDAGKTVVCFEEFAAVLRDDPSPLAQRFANSLQVWSRHQAGTPQPSDHACVGCRAAA